MKIKEIDTRIERNRIILELYDYIKQNSKIPAECICSTLYKNLNKRVCTRKDFIEFFSDDSNLVVGIGEKSLKVIREFLGITEVTYKYRKDIFNGEEEKKALLDEIREYLNTNYPDYKYKNGICNVIGRALKTHNISTKEELKKLIYKSKDTVRGIGPKFKDILADYFN
jgi:hypothetical protein